MDTAHIHLATDASFASAKGLRSQLGFLIMLSDEDGNTNVLHYRSSRCKGITGSVMAAEVHALILGFDQAYTARDLLTEITWKHLDITGHVYNKTLFDVVSKEGTTAKKRLLIDIWALKESYSRGKLKRLSWLPGKSNCPMR